MVYRQVLGSQVNTGYGSLVRAGESKTEAEFFSLDFALEGQLIHGRQQFTPVELERSSPGVADAG